MPTEKEARGHNRLLAKKRVQCLNEALTAVLLCGVLRVKFSTDRKFCVPRSATALITKNISFNEKKYR
jgi:hypothetical protein